MTPWIAIGIALTTADGISIAGDAFDLEPNVTEKLCWQAQGRIRRKDRTRLYSAVQRAAKATRPPHVRFEVERVKRASAPGCRGVMQVSVKGRTHARITVGLRGAEDTRSEQVASFRRRLSRLQRQDFEASWRMAWRRWAPAAPPAPPRPPPLDRDPRPKPAAPFVDQELADEQAVARAAARPPPPPPRGPPMVTVLAEAGWAGRQLKDAPGAPQSTASVPTFGLRAVGYLGPLLALGPHHELEVVVGYWRRLVDGQQGLQALSVTADRAAVYGRYRYAVATNLLGAMSPRIGPQVGYELARFENTGDAVLSTRFSVLRLGLDISQPMLQFADAVLRFESHAALRWSPSGDARVGVDVRGGFGLQFGWGLFVDGAVRFTQQPGQVDDTAFVDETIEALAAVGWSL